MLCKDGGVKRAIFFDVDGTILNRNQQVSPATREALHKASANGHELFLCTGRSKREIYPWLWELGFSGLVGGNGAYVEHNGTVLSDVNFSASEITELHEWLSGVGAEYIWQAADAMYPVGKFLDRFRNLENDNHIPGDWRAYAALIAPYIRSGTPQVASKVTFVLPPERGMTIADVEEQFAGRFAVVDGSVQHNAEVNGEISPLGMNKSVGLRVVAEALGLPISQTVAIGDSANDLEMLAAAGVGIAMGNGTDQVKEVADWITRSIDDDGVAYALDRLGLTQ